jgi:NAD(P)-dependent dehydrogenase (short-subunit alcohol dehydrogenase family)
MPDGPGRAALVTGGSAGIGLAVAGVLVDTRHAVTIVGRDGDRLAAAVEELRGRGGNVTGMAADAADPDSVARVVSDHVAAFGRLDVVVANAGFGVVGPVQTLTVDDYRRQFETNVFGVIRTAHATLADLRKTSGRFVVIGSVSSHVSVAGSSAYSMSKFAVRAFAASLGHEMVPHGVTVTLISPGFVDSEIRRVDNRGVLREGGADSVPRWLIVPTPVAARQIVRAIARRRREAVITGHGRITVFMQRHAPWLIDWIVSRFGVKSRAQPPPAT